MKNASRSLLITMLGLSVALAFADEADELARQLQNPVSSLIRVPFQFNWDTKIGPLDQGNKFTLNFQPVVPVALSQDWNVIIRTIEPYVWQEDVLAGPTPSFPGLPRDAFRGIAGAARADATKTVYETDFPASKTTWPASSSTSAKAAPIPGCSFACPRRKSRPAQSNCQNLTTKPPRLHERPNASRSGS